MELAVWTRNEIQDQARQAIFEAITRSTVTLGPSRNVPLDKLAYGSGVCVEFDGKPFIATARHVLDNLDELGFAASELLIGSRPDVPLVINFTGRIPLRISGAVYSPARRLPISEAIQSDQSDDLGSSTRRIIRALQTDEISLSAKRKK
jgi:hypothetical protein